MLSKVLMDVAVTAVKTCNLTFFSEPLRGSVSSIKKKSGYKQEPLSKTNY